MGFDNECILNIQSLAGEYFCPVCRLLVYPNEAIQTQCTHLYCKPCLTYVVSTTRACPYDGYLVTEADSKPLMEANKPIAEAIGRITVHCLYHRSGCTWQGPLSECTTHCAGCGFGSSPVVCNRCGTQIVHRQVQEHAQNCPGVQPAPQQAEIGQSQGSAATTEQNPAAASQAGQPTSQDPFSQTVAAPTAGQDQSQANQSAQPQTVAQGPTSEQWYQQQQQYQQYYQQFPGYDPYQQQQFQQYDQYQQQVQQQHLPAHPQGQVQLQPYLQPQPQAQAQTQPHVHPQPQPQAQAQPQVHPQPQPQVPAQAQAQSQVQAHAQPHPQAQAQQQAQPQPLSQPHPHHLPQMVGQPPMQAQVNPQQQLQTAIQQHPPMQPQAHPPPQVQLQVSQLGHPHPQLHPQAQPHPQPHSLPQQAPQMPQQQQSHPQQQSQIPPHQQPHPQQLLHPQSHPQQAQPHTHTHPQPQLQHQPQPQLQPQPQPQPQPHFQPQPQPPPQHQLAHAVTGHQSYPQPPHQQMPPPGAPQPHPMHIHSQQQATQNPPHHPVQMQGQFPPQQPPQMRQHNAPPQSHLAPVQHTQQHAMLPPQGLHPNAPPAQHHPAHQPSQQIHHHHPGMQLPQQQSIPPQQPQFPQHQAQGYLPQSQPFPGQTHGMVHHQPHQQGPFLSQQPIHPQQSLRPQGPVSSLQPHPHAHAAQVLASHQSQIPAGRPMMQPFPQSPSGLAGPGHGQDVRAVVKPGQLNTNQLSPNQNYLPRTNIRSQLSSEQPLGSMKESLLPRSGSQTALLPASPASQLGTNNSQIYATQAALKTASMEKQGDSVLEKNQVHVLKAEMPSQDAGRMESKSPNDTHIHGADINELKIPKSGSDLKSTNDEEKLVSDDEDKSNHPDNSVNEVSNSSPMLIKDQGLLAQDGNSKEPVIKQILLEEAPEKLSESSHSGFLTDTKSEDQEDDSHSVPKPYESSLQEVKEEIKDGPPHNNLPSQSDVQSIPGTDKGSQTPRALGPLNPQGPVPGSDRINMQPPPQQLPNVADVGRDLLQQQPLQNVVPNHERALPHSGYQERNLPGFPRQGLGPDDQRGHPHPGKLQSKGFAQPSHPVPISEQERYQQLSMPYGPPPHMQDRPPQQRPPPPDKMLQPHMLIPGTNQERRMHEPQHQMPLQPQPLPQMRPQMHSSLENFLPPGHSSLVPDHFPPPMAKHPHGSFPAMGMPTQYDGRGPTHMGPPQRSFESQGNTPQGHNQGHMPPPHVAAPRIPQGELLAGPLLGGAPPPGAYEASGGMMGRGPPHGPEGQMGRPPPTNPMEAEMFTRRPGFFDGRRPDSHPPSSADHVPFGQPSGLHSNTMSTNGVPSKGLVGGVQDTSYPHGLMEERFKPLAEERYKPSEEIFKPLSEERFKPFSLDPGRRATDRRDFEEDLKQFPRHSQFDGEAVPKYESYLSSSRPLDMGPHGFGNDAVSRPLDRAPHGLNHDVGPKSDGSSGVTPSRSLPPYQVGGSSVQSIDIGERSRHMGIHDDNIGRKTDPIGAHPEFLRPISEFGRHRVDSLPSTRSPSRFGSISTGLGLGNQTRVEGFDGRERGFGERSRTFNIPSDLVGNSFHESRFPMFPPAGSGTLPSHLRRGEIDGTGNLPVHLLRGGESDIIPSHLRSAEPVGPHNLPSHLRTGEPVGQGQLRMSEPSGFGSFPSQMRMGESAGLGNLPSHLRIGDAIREGNLPSQGRIREPGFGSSFPMKGFPNDGGFYNPRDMESFDHSRKRKPGSMGWCRICKIDCETVEGLDLHSQTREHQKMAMDMVLSIKQGSAKKQKLSSEDHISLDDANKSRKTSFESRGNRH